MLLALFGLAAGQAVVWYTGQFYALFFLTQTLKVEANSANIMIAIALLLATPFFVFWGWLSDKVGRKPVMLFGMILALVTFFPGFHALTKAANPALPVVLKGDAAAQYETVMQVLEVAKKLDITEIGLVTKRAGT